MLPPKTSLALKAGDVFSTIPHGGGGFGDPLDRDPTLVLRDVAERAVSLDGARRHYGVVIAGQPLQVDLEATEKLRLAIRRDRIDKPRDAAPARRANGDAHPHDTAFWHCAGERRLGLR